MKKILVILLAAALLLTASACGRFVSIMPGTEISAPVQDGPDDEAAFEEESLFSFLGWGSFGESYYSDTPVALSYQTEAGESGVRGCRAYVFDRATIIAACDALRSMTLTGRSTEPTVPGAEYVLTLPSGTEHAVVFDMLQDGTHVLSTYAGDYTIAGGEALWDIEFPAYSLDFDVFDLYFSSDMRAFADGFYDDLPVSVGYRMGSGATISSTDPDVVTAAFRALASATVSVVENHPDQSIDLSDVRDYIFTMADGSTQTFSFADRCLAVTASPAFGTVYYRLDGIDALWAVDILPETQNGRFEGGRVGELKEDFTVVEDIVSGRRDDLEVSGVFVQYAIGEDGAYLTLSGELAAEFLTRVCAVTVTDETAEPPEEGDTITISVTLSDSTGPMIYFMGDTVQQIVGINYMCDSGDMDGLRTYILGLAAEGNNEAEIAESTND